MVLSFADPQAALDALDTDPQLTVYIGGVLTDVVHFDAQFGWDQERATGKLQVLLPRDEHIVPNAVVEVQAGHNDLVGTVFSGYIPAWKGSLTERGALLDITMVGWCGLLAEPEREDLVFQGPISAASIFVALCELKGIPSYIVDEMTYPDGVTEIMLGGNPQIDGGTVTIKAESSPIGQYNRLIDPYFYRAFDTPQGPVTVRRANGTPPTASVVTFTEGVNLISVEREMDTRQVVSAWDINGQTYEDEFGAKVPIRSRPEEDVSNPDIYPNSRRYKRLTNSDIVRQDQADAIRQNHEIAYGAPQTPVRISAIGLPGIAPGDVVTIDSATVEANGEYWVTDIDLTHDGAFTATYRGWAGNGDPLPALNERIVIPIQTAPVHLGDEYVSHYAVPAHQGVEKTWTFTLPAKVTVANVRGYHHSTNSQTVAGADTELNVSGFEVWKAGVDRKNTNNRPESQGSLVRLPEEYGRRRNYSLFETITDGDGNVTVTNPGFWTPLAVNLRTLDMGEYVLVLKAGKGGEAIGYDDFEARLLYLECFGAVEPAEVV